MRPFNVVVVNAMSVSTGRRHAREILLNAAEYGDLILGSECGDFNGHELLGDDFSVHHNLLDYAHAGSLIALHKRRGHLVDRRTYLGVKRQEGDSIRNRYLLTAHAHIDCHKDLKVLAGHAPPPRDFDRWVPFMRNVARQHADLAGADWNKPARAVHRVLGSRVRGVDVLGLAVRRGIPTSKPVPLDVGGDHLATLVTLWPERK